MLIGKKAFPSLGVSKKRGLEEMESAYLEKRPQAWAPSKEPALPPVAYLPDFQVLEGQTPYLPQKEAPKPAETPADAPQVLNPYIPSPERPVPEISAEPLIVVDKRQKQDLITRLREEDLERERVSSAFTTFERHRSNLKLTRAATFRKLPVTQRSLSTSFFELHPHLIYRNGE